MERILAELVAYAIIGAVMWGLAVLWKIIVGGNNKDDDSKKEN